MQPRRASLIDRDKVVRRGWVPMRSAELEARRRAAAIASRMFLACCRSFLVGYNRRKNIARVLPEMLLIMAIRENDVRGRPPISANKIAKKTGVPRANVRRGLTYLIKHGIIEVEGKGYVGVDSFLEERLRAPYFQHVIAAIRAAAHMLENYK